MGRESRRDALLEAAGRVLQREGATRLTLDAVAEEAGVSKGGVMYHFPTKSALVEALLRGLMETIESDAAALAAAEPPSRGRWARAFIKAATRLDPARVNFGRALMAVLLLEQDGMPSCDQQIASWLERLRSDGLDEVTATLVRLVIDGFWFTEIFSAAPPGTLREQALAIVIELTKEPAAAQAGEMVKGVGYGTTS